MIRRFQGLSESSRSATGEAPDGVFLVRVERAQYHWHAHKPYYVLRFSIMKPQQFEASSITGRVYCTPRALWKLSWFLSDFGYDTELLGHDEIDDKRLVGLTGVVKISHVLRNGTSLLNFDAFAPAEQWSQLSSGSNPQSRNWEAAS